jgi:hypothetical protein
MTQNAAVVQIGMLNKMFSSMMALLTPLEILKAIVEPFTRSAVEVYKQAQQEKVWRQAGFGGTFLAKHQGILHDSEVPPLTALIIAALGFFIAAASAVTAIFTHTSLMLKIAAWSFGACLFIVIFGFLIFWYIHKLAHAGAIGSFWEATFFAVNDMPSDIPREGRVLVKRIHQAIPTAKFSIERLWVDPLLKVCLPDGGSYYFYGWNGDKKLVEEGGVIVEV